MPELYDQDKDTGEVGYRLGRLRAIQALGRDAMITSSSVGDLDPGIKVQHYLDFLDPLSTDSWKLGAEMEYLFYGEPQIGYAGPEEFAPEDLGVSLDVLAERIDLKDFQEIVALARIFYEDLLPPRDEAGPYMQGSDA